MVNPELAQDKIDRKKMKNEKSDPFEIEYRLDGIADDFEAGWSVENPNFEKFLNQVEPNIREKLLFLLLEVDSELRTDANSNLNNSLHVSQTLETVVAGTTSPDTDSAVEQIGNPKAKINDYRLLEKLGVGGMGEVWIAAQTKPMKRRVAVKLVKSGIESKEVIQRFKSERNALALMNHPNIAKILDAGETVDGQPFFVMELVEEKSFESLGKSITEYCDANRLNIRERLHLFTAICSGVQHAHQKGVIHRDLKPGNILVAVENGIPVPKVIDFGLVKLLNQADFADHSLRTVVGQVMGTPEYMSPEQASLDHVDVDTRSDVYSLGIILFELLTGTTPLGKANFEGDAIFRILNEISGMSAPKPSERLANLNADVLNTTSKLRCSEPSKLSHILRGELDWIVMKALDLDRSRRYQSASSFASDITSYLENKPIVARPTSRLYLARKFIRRNRLLITAALMFLLLLLGGIVGTSFGFISATIAKNDALKLKGVAEKAALMAQREAKRATGAEEIAKKNELIALNQKEAAEQANKKAQFERQRAESEASVALTVRQFMERKLLRQADYWAQASNSIDGSARQSLTVREALDRAALEFSPKNITQKFPGKPEVQAAILETIATTYSGIEAHEPAKQFLSYALKIRKRNQAGKVPSPKLLQCQVKQLFVAIKSEDVLGLTGSFSDVITSTRDVLSLELSDFQDSGNEFNLEYEVDRRISAIFDELERWMNPDLAMLPIFQGRLTKLGNVQAFMQIADALSKTNQVHDQFEQRYGLTDIKTGYLKVVLACQQFVVARIRESSPLARNFFAEAQGSISNSIRMLTEVLKIANDKFDNPNDFRIGGLYSILGVFHAFSKHTDKFEKAGECFCKSALCFESELGELHPASLMSRGLHGDMLHRCGNYGLAVAVLKANVRNRKATFGNQFIYYQDTILALGSAHLLRAKHAALKPKERTREAEIGLNLVEESLQLLESSLGPTHLKTAGAAFRLGNACWELEKYASAEKAYRKAWNAVKSETTNALDPATIALHRIVESNARMKNWDEAIQSAQNLIKIRSSLRHRNKSRILKADKFRLANLFKIAGLTNKYEQYLNQHELVENTFQISLLHRPNENTEFLAGLQESIFFVSDIAVKSSRGKDRVEFTLSSDSRGIRSHTEFDMDSHVIDRKTKQYSNLGYDLHKKVSYQAGNSPLIAAVWHKTSAASNHVKESSRSSNK